MKRICILCAALLALSLPLVCAACPGAACARCRIDSDGCVACLPRPPRPPLPLADIVWAPATVPETGGAPAAALPLFALCGATWLLRRKKYA